MKPDGKDLPGLPGPLQSLYLACESGTLSPTYMHESLRLLFSIAAVAVLAAIVAAQAIK